MWSSLSWLFSCDQHCDQHCYQNHHHNQHLLVIYTVYKISTESRTVTCVDDNANTSDKLQAEELRVPPDEELIMD